MNRDEFVEKLKEQLDKWNTDIDTLEVKAHAAKEEVKVKYQETAVMVKEKREEAGKKLTEIKSASGDAWHDLRAGAETAFGALKEAVFKARTHFQDSPEHSGAAEPAVEAASNPAEDSAENK